MEGAPTLLKLSMSECPDLWKRLPHYKWPTYRQNIEELVVSLKRNLCGHPLADSIWERQFEKGLLENGWRKAPTWECLSVQRRQGLILSFYADDIKVARQEQKCEPMSNKMMDLIDMEKPTELLDQVYLGCFQRKCMPNTDIIDEYRKMFESRISAGSTEKLPNSGKENGKEIVWSYDMAGHAQKCVERYSELANKNIEQLCKVSTPYIDNRQFKKEELETVRELSKVCSQIVLKCLYLARIGRPDIPWSAN